jgi:hypothetical protein
MKSSRFASDNVQIDWSYVLAFIGVSIATFFFVCVWIKSF